MKDPVFELIFEFLILLHFKNTLFILFYGKCEAYNRELDKLLNILKLVTNACYSLTIRSMFLVICNSNIRDPAGIIFNLYQLMLHLSTYFLKSVKEGITLTVILRINKKPPCFHVLIH